MPPSELHSSSTSAYISNSSWSSPVQGEGDSDRRAKFIGRILEVVENLHTQPQPGNHGDSTREQSIEDMRQGMTSNMALISAAVRSRKGCLAPKIDFVPHCVAAESEEFRLAICNCLLCWPWLGAQNSHYCGFVSNCTVNLWTVGWRY